MGVQVPGWPTRLHARHAPLHAVLQQTPFFVTGSMSAQWVDAHSVLALQTAPFILRPQVPFTHLRPLTQSRSLEQVAKHALVAELHENGAHNVEAPNLQVPVPLQVKVPVTASASQLPALQTVPDW
jgi:hypothetical protein